MADAAGTMGMPPGGFIEIAFSFDTTGSMNSCIGKVREQVVEIITRLLGDVPFLRIAVFAHGDYCDANKYITKHVDFTRDTDELCKFVKNVQGTGGGDWEECYELVLQEVRTKLSWQPGTQRALVMIGDAVPHEVEYYSRGFGKKKRKAIDWKEETRRLHEETGVHVYAVQCTEDHRATPFWEHIAESTDGKHLKLQKFASIVEMMMAICYRETGPDVFAAYEREIRDREGAALRKDLDVMFGDLRDTTAPRPALKKTDSTSSLVKRMMDKLESDNSDSDSDESAMKMVPKRRRAKKTKRKVAVPAKAVSLATAPRKATAPKKRAKSAEKFLENNKMDKKPREKTGNKDFVFNDLPWSRWQVAMTPKTGTTSRGRWRPRTAGRPGMRNVALFETGREEPALYEFGVQLAGKQAKHVMLVKYSSGFETPSWDLYLLRELRVRKQIDNILNHGHKLYVRRAMLSLPCYVSIEGQYVKVTEGDKLKRLLTALYDYPWTERRLTAKDRGTRQVKRSGVIISGNKTGKEEPSGKKGTGKPRKPTEESPEESPEESSEESLVESPVPTEEPAPVDWRNLPAVATRSSGPSFNFLKGGWFDESGKKIDGP